MIIEFEKNEEYYAAKADEFSVRGDGYRSLLYARKAADCGGRRGRMRYALSLYETGSLDRAAEEYMSLYDEGTRTPELYARLVKTLCAMSRYASATYFMREGLGLGYFPRTRASKLSDASDVRTYAREISAAFGDNAMDLDTARLVYVLALGELSDNKTFITDMWMGGENPADAALLYRVASVVTPDRINRQTAETFLDMYDNKLSDDDRMRADLLATRVAALLALGRDEEAEDAADDLAALELPEDPVDLIKSAIAMISLGDHESASDYLEELLACLPEKRIMLTTAIANMNIGEYERAAELFARVLVIDPDCYAARYWLGCLHKKQQCFTEYDELLPLAEEKRLRDGISDMLAFAASRPGVMKENDVMRCKLRYVVRGGDTSYARYVVTALAALGIYGDVVRAALIAPGGSAELMRDVSAELISRDRSASVDAFVFGMRRIAVPYDAASSRVRRNVFRAYAYAYTTSAVFGLGAENKLSAVLPKAETAFENEELAGDTAVRSAAAAMLLQAEADGLDNASDAVGAVGKASVKDAERLLGLLRGSGGKRKKL